MKEYGPPQTRDAARQVLAQHTRRDGICEGCLASWARLVPFPCAQVLAARALLGETGETESGAGEVQPDGGAPAAG